MRLHLVRHPAPAIPAGLCYGQLDVPAPFSPVELATLRDCLPRHCPVWSSPLQRCLRLAEALFAEVDRSPALMEMHFGAWEGQAWNAIPRAEIDAWAADLLDYVPPGGESARMLGARIEHFLAGLAVEEAVLVTHAGVMRWLLARSAGQPLAEMLSRTLPFAGVVTVDWVKQDVA